MATAKHFLQSNVFRVFNPSIRSLEGTTPTDNNFIKAIAAQREKVVCKMARKKRSESKTKPVSIDVIWLDIFQLRWSALQSSQFVFLNLFAITLQQISSLLPQLELVSRRLNLLFSQLVLHHKIFSSACRHPVLKAVTLNYDLLQVDERRRCPFNYFRNHKVPQCVVSVLKLCTHKQPNHFYFIVSFGFVQL